MITMKSTIIYPQVIRELLEMLGCPLNLDGCHKAFALLRANKADEEIADAVLASHPALLPLVERFKEEGASFVTLCLWLRVFIEDAAWLTGNRDWPMSECICLKNVDGRFGWLSLANGVGRIISRNDNTVSWSYPSVFEALLDGWSVD